MIDYKKVHLDCVMCVVLLADHPTQYMCLHLTGVLPPSLLFLYFVYGVYSMFTPLMGRVGSELIPDMFIGGISTIIVIILMGYQVIILQLISSVKCIE